MKQINILFVDEAVEFGGSLVVLGSLVDAIDKRLFRPVVVGEVDTCLQRDFIHSDVTIYKISRIYNYAHWFRTVDLIRRLPGSILGKVVNYILSFVRTLVNTIYQLRLTRIVLKERVDIIHVNNGLNNLAPVVVAVLLGRKFVVHVHGMENPGVIQKLMIKTVPQFITISDYMKTGLVRNGFPKKRVVVIPNPVSAKTVSQLSTSNLRKRYGIDEDDQILGIVGRIIRWKGHVEFLAAASRAMSATPGLKILIVGDFSDGDNLYKDEIMMIVEESGYKDRVIFTGYVRDVENHYSLMTVCVHASVDPEPFGLVVTEAMAYGVPVIASNRGAPREIITDGENGFLIDPEDTDKLADIIISLLGDDLLRSRIGAKGKDHVLRNYQVGAYARAMENVYLEVLGRN